MKRRIGRPARFARFAYWRHVPPQYFRVLRWAPSIMHPQTQHRGAGEIGIGYRIVQYGHWREHGAYHVPD